MFTYIDSGGTPNLPIPGRIDVPADIITTQMRLKDVCPHYSGPDIHLDFDRNKQLIGIDIMV